MKRLLLGFLITAAAGSAQAAVLFDNGPAVAGTPPLSVVRSGGTLFGAGAQTGTLNAVADDFTVGGAGWNVQSLSFYAYQTFANNQFTFTGATWSIVSGDVNAGSVAASGSNAPVTNGGLLGYRVTSATLAETTRAIFQVDVDVPDFVLSAGTYWLHWSLNGSTGLAGPWIPPSADGAIGNAQQSLAGGAFNALVDAGDGLGVSLPFTIRGSIVEGTEVPEPGTYALMLAGGLAAASIVRRRRRTG